MVQDIAKGSGEAIGEGLADIGKDKIKDELQRRKTARVFEDIAESVVASLEKTLTQGQQGTAGIRLEAVTSELALRTMRQNLSGGG